MVYFVQSPATGLVKIGFSLELPRRLLELQRRNKEHLLMLGRLVGGKQIEGMLHKRFWHRHVGREWFVPNEEMAELIQQVAPGPYVSAPLLTGAPQLVQQWPWYSYKVRQVLRNEPYRRNVRKDPDPLPLPCCPMLQPAGSSVAPLDPSARSPHPRAWIK